MRIAALARRYLKPAVRKASADVPSLLDSDGKAWPTFHSFRHTFASRAYKSGARLGYISRWLGHATPAFTWAQYVTVFEDDHSEESMEWADALDRVPEHAPSMPPSPMTA